MSELNLSSGVESRIAKIKEDGLDLFYFSFHFLFSFRFIFDFLFLE